MGHQLEHFLVDTTQCGKEILIETGKHCCLKGPLAQVAIKRLALVKSG